MILMVGRYLKGKVKGYFSVEAALVFPIVVGTIMLLMYLGFYQYDRCMLEFDVAMIALRGSCCDEKETEGVLDEMERAARELSGEKYIVWEAESIRVEMKGTRVRALGGGKLSFPFGFLLQKGTNGVWEAEANYENKRLDPVTFIHWYKRMVGG